MTETIQTINTYANEGAFIIAAFMGGLAHYLKKALRGETTTQMHEWFGSANLASTVYTIIVFFFVLVGALAGGIVDAHTTFWTSLYMGFTTGFAIDAGFNSDQSITAQLNTVKSEGAALFVRNTEAQDDEAPSNKVRVVIKRRT
jgi:hypothetical protein